MNESYILGKDALRAEIERLQEWNRLRAMDIVTLGQEVGKLEAEIERLRATLEIYACPGLGKCPVQRMKDGSCLRASTGGLCGDDACNALAGKEDR